jgi:hypothetical protein
VAIFAGGRRFFVRVTGCRHAYYLMRLFADGLELQAAMDQPRLFPLPGTNSVEAEETLREIIKELFTKRGFKVQPPRWPIGGAQAIAIDWDTGVLTGGIRSSKGRLCARLLAARAAWQAIRRQKQRQCISCFGSGFPVSTSTEDRTRSKAS